MDEEGNSSKVNEKSLPISESDYKAVGEKRPSPNVKINEHNRKRLKMRDLGSLIMATERSFGGKEHNFCLQSNENDVSQVNAVPLPAGHIASQAGKTGTSASLEEVDPAVRTLDLNSEDVGATILSCEGSSDSSNNPTKASFPGKQDRSFFPGVKTRGIGVEFNAEDVTRSINLGSSQSYKEHKQFKSNDVSETGSCTGPLKEKDPMRLWMEMKQNGFVSSSYGGIPMPKKRGRKSKDDILKKRLELARKEQVDRFSKIAAPSGLLNDLNPGIINHVRNKKQVHSIIEAIVSEKNENANIRCKHAKKYQMQKSKVSENDTCSVDKEKLTSFGSQFTNLSEDNILALKLSSSTKASAGSCSNEESSNFSSVSSLSMKAASVASQWLELLHQDLKTRLSALRRSRKRVRAVIHTELPYLLAKEFSNLQEHDSSVMKTNTELPDSIIAEMHRVRWTSLFDKMDGALAEEEKQLEIWLNQVKEKQLLCDQGLQHVNFDMQQMRTMDKGSSVSSGKELAVSAAAASIYSTCSLLLSES